MDAAMSNYPTLARLAVTSHKEIWVEVELDPLSWDTLIGVLHVVWILAVNTIHTGDDHCFLTVR